VQAAQNRSEGDSGSDSTNSGNSSPDTGGGGLASLGPSVNTPEAAFGNPTFTDLNHSPAPIYSEKSEAVNSEKPEANTPSGLDSLGPPVNTPEAASDKKVTAPLSANAQIQNIINTGSVTDASGNTVTDSYGVPVLSGDAAKLVSSGLAHYDTVIGSPTYHQWVAGPSQNGTPGSVGKNGEWNFGTAVNGMTMEQLSKLSEEGRGSMMISDTQSVDNAMAALNFDRAMTKYVAPAIVAAVPGGSFAVTTGKMLGDLSTGKISFGDVASNLLVGLGANALGISPGTATALLNMDWGKAVANEGMKPLISTVVKSIAKSTGLPASVVSYGLQQTGYAKDVSSAISQYVNGLIPGDPTNNIGAIAQFIDGTLGTNTTSQVGGSGGLPTFNVTGEYTYQPSGGSGSSNTTTTPEPTTPAATPTAPLGALPTTQSSASPIPWLDTSASILQNKAVDRKTLTPQEIQQIQSKLDPSLVEQIQNRYSFPQQGGLSFFAGGGGVTCYNEDPKYMPKFVDDKEELLQSSGRHQPLSLKQLKHLSTQISPLGNMGGLASGGLPKKYHDAMPQGHKPEFITGMTGYYACGGGTGQSDDIPAMLHDGDYVMDADVVAALGDGSSKAGREILEGFRKQVPHKETNHGQPVPAKIADGEYVFPAGFVNALGGGDNKAGAKVLDGLREKLRAHKRSAPTSKIPPKAKSPLDYIKQLKG